MAKRAKTTGIEATAQAAIEAARQATVSYGSVAKLTEGLESIQSLAQGWQSVGHLATAGLDRRWLKLLPDVTVQAGQTEALDQLLGGVAAESWRDTLAGPGTAAMVAERLTDPISSAIALRHTWANSDALAGLDLAGIDTSIRLPNIGQDIARIAEQATQSHFRELWDQVAKTQRWLTEALRPTAFLSSLNLATQSRRYRERWAKLDKDIRRLGWTLPSNWSVPVAAEFVEYGLDNGKRALDRVICDQYRHNRGRRLRSMVALWNEEPAFRERRHIVKVAVADHMAGRYVAAIPTLLPLIEGITWQVFDPTGTLAEERAKREHRRAGTNPVRALEVDPETIERVLTDALLHTVNLLWEVTNFSAVPRSSRRLNRHSVLHGRTHGYGREANSLRVFFALDHLASIVATKRDHESRSRAV